VLHADADFRSLADGAPDIIARFDRQHRHVYVNRAIAAATGRSADALLGRTSAEAGFPADVAERWRDALARVLDQGTETALEFECETPRGRRYFHARIVPEGGTPPLTALAITRDVTDSRLMAEARQTDRDANYEFLAEMMPQLVWTTRPDGAVDYCNSH
jgi:PAS domain S-box-containing protein